jgi:two-component sensor histidine kinase/CheY-like chemotaxis protein
MAIALRDGSSFREEAVDIRRPDGSQVSVRVNIDPIRDDAGRIVGAINVFHDVTELRRAEEAGALLVAELNHRVKNTLASVQAIAQRTLRRTRDPEEFVTSFSGRIQSLARVHSILSANTWRSADLRELAHDQIMQGAADETRIAVVGPRLQLTPQLALHLALMLHELSTNAVKYGALSTAEGRVTVGWTVEDRTLRLRWEERGGPPARVPTKRGFGTTLIEQSAKGEGGSAHMLVESDGIAWDITLPLPQLDPAISAGQSSAPVGGDLARRDIIEKSTGQLSGKRFLIVEDEPLVALDIADTLVSAGAEVIGSFGSAKEALAAIESRQMDAALLDGNLHGQPVDEIAVALTRRNVPFVFVTGYGREALPKAFRNVGILSKPFGQPQLIEAAARLVERSDTVVRLRDH